ncbi:hypothetical protein MLD38_031452 [Melastoma candidum]|uniref:Uncharacterized protein n=1 Tax=Melastoma candidum TaxID=119954 RepID=A0ACB9MRS9_9MYRT|nr:hypothetical protein MLD38_031452 [Melastoma candidum]
MHNDTETNDNNGKNNHHRHRHYYNGFQPHPVSIIPRISFSNDFVESHGNCGSGATSVALRQEPRAPYSPEAAAGSSDFEFSVSNHNMMSADELFFKGRILPSFRESKTTLREELLVEEEEEEGKEEEEEVSERRPTRGSVGRSSTVGRWKGFLGLRKGRKKGDSNKCEEGSGDRAFDNNSSQEMLNDGAINNFK